VLIRFAYLAVTNAFTRVLAPHDGPTIPRRSDRSP